MAKIKCKGAMERFTGQIGPVRFADGEAETSEPAMLRHFGRDTKRYSVTKTAAEVKAEKAAAEAAEKAREDAEREAAEKAAADDKADKGADENSGS